ncbi:MAG: sigma-54 dependent transcriptional regulator [Prevotellaceae bacterium]|nr:sigma-54 dependent transcriptional regulator [Prevotellaceae bacterium]
MPHILIIEDDLTFATMIQSWLKRKGFNAERAGSVGAAVRLLSSDDSFDIVLSDLRLPDHDGLYLLSWMRKKSIDIPFIVMTSYAEVQNAVLAMKSGACDYIGKPVQPDILLQKINDALKGTKADGEDDAKAKKKKESGVPRYIEGTSDASRQLYEYVSLVAPTPLSVLILGASGTGKEYVARRIHEQSSRSAKPFFALDCGAIPKDVAASEFFGYVKGAFTGAATDKKGAFEEANGGTLFLDEVGNLTYDVQVQLLRALQERRIRPLGSAKEISVDIRLVCATNGNLSELVADGKFREDLYHRINEFTIFMPELKDRGTDLFLFADLFVKQANEELGRNVIGFDDKASEMLARHSWTGNLRELNNVVKRATLLARGSYIGAEELGKSISPAIQETMPLHDEQSEKERILSALRQTGGNKTKTARLLAIDRKTLYNKMQKYGLKD